jgi:hypothetical protein
VLSFSPDEDLAQEITGLSGISISNHKIKVYTGYDQQIAAARPAGR